MNEIRYENTHIFYEKPKFQNNIIICFNRGFKTNYLERFLKNPQIDIDNFHIFILFLDLILNIPKAVPNEENSTNVLLTAGNLKLSNCLVLGYEFFFSYEYGMTEN